MSKLNGEFSKDLISEDMESILKNYEDNQKLS